MLDRLGQHSGVVTNYNTTTVLFTGAVNFCKVMVLLENNHLTMF